jgi:hypothetical protein
MKRTVFSTAVLLLCLICIYNVTAYTSSLVESKVVLSVTTPYNALVSFVPLKNRIVIRQGEKNTEALQVTNNLGAPISFSLEYSHKYLSLGQPEEAFLYPGSSSVITLSAHDKCPTGDVVLPIALQADFEGGRCSVSTDLTVQVIEGDLQLRLIEGTVVSSWNGGSAPEATEVFYRYRHDSEDEWSDWIDIEEGGTLGIPGYYQYKAVLGETESRVISNYLEPFLDKEDGGSSSEPTYQDTEESSSEGETYTEN